ncbi:hypothetical protein POUND7_014319 [Theobroma cacao]
MASLLPRNPTDQSRLTKFNNSRTHVGSPPMRHPTPTLRFVSSNIITINSHITQDPRRLLLVSGCFQSKSMATENGLSKASLAIEDTGDDKKKGDEEKLAKKLPPPPEKPEPGDCCGSGCVRCVWDVYYEELEVYNKLRESDSKAPKS